MPLESRIIINDIPITSGMAMTIRVALNSFAMELQTSGLGDDEVGKSMTESHLYNIKQIKNLIMR